MTEAQRHQILLELLAQTGFITVEKVIERLGISPATARRDINKLDESGKLKKVRNGAEAISQQRPRWTPMNIHQAQNHDEKVRIARAASQLVNPGESVVINCGSTAFLLGREMCGKPVQIITNYLPLANYLIDQEHESVVIMGGQYNKSQSITLSPQDSENSLYAGHWMFTSGKGLTAEGLYKTDMLTAMAEQNMLNVVGKLVVLVDSSKVGERAGMLFSRAEQIDLVITGKGGFTRTLQARHQHHGRWLSGQVKHLVLFAHRRNQFVTNDFDELLTRGQALVNFMTNRLLFNAVDKITNNRQRDVCFQQRHAHFAQRFLDVVFSKASAAADVAQRARQTIG